jgi:hypothetical protein
MLNPFKRFTLCTYQTAASDWIKHRHQPATRSRQSKFDNEALGCQIALGNETLSVRPGYSNVRKFGVDDKDF